MEDGGDRPAQRDSRGLAGLDLADDGRCRAGRDISTSDAGFVSIGSRYRSCEARQRALSHGFAGFRHRELRPRPGGGEARARIRNAGCGGPRSRAAASTSKGGPGRRGNGGRARGGWESSTRHYGHVSKLAAVNELGEAPREGRGTSRSNIRHADMNAAWDRERPWEKWGGEEDRRAVSVEWN